MSETEKRAEPTSWWFQGDSVVELKRQLGEVDAATAVFEVVRHGNKVLLSLHDGDPALTQRLRTPINESHPCPPDCR